MKRGEDRYNFVSPDSFPSPVELCRSVQQPIPSLRAGGGGGGGEGQKEGGERKGGMEGR